MQSGGKVKKSTQKVNFYSTLLELLLEGKDPVKELGISKQSLYYHRRQMRDLGILKKEKGIWTVLKSKKIDIEHAISWKDKHIRGHAFIWTVFPSHKYDWKKLLNSTKIPYQLIRGYTPRLFIRNSKVWLGKDIITIYDPRSFYGKNAVESRKYAVIGLIETLSELQNKLGISFNYKFKVNREHFAMIHNELARQVNRAGDKLYVKDELDGEWLWIDLSDGIGELETGGKGITMDRAHLSMKAQEWYNDMKKTSFEVTSSFVLKTLSQVTQNQQMFNQNFESHVASIKELGAAASANSKTTELLADAVNDMKNVFTEQIDALKEEIKKIGNHSTSN
jgi:hypothetical protein